VEARLLLKRLNKEEKLALFSEIRWGFLKHKELLSLRQNQVFDLAKNLIVEGLSVRLDPHEVAAKDVISINMHPRVRYDHQVEHEEMSGKAKKGMQSKLAGISPVRQVSDLYYPASDRYEHAPPGN
jgi:hypothetical protein